MEESPSVLGISPDLPIVVQGPGPAAMTASENPGARPEAVRDEAAARPDHEAEHEQKERSREKPAAERAAGSRAAPLRSHQSLLLISWVQRCLTASAFAACSESGITSAFL